MAQPDNERFRVLGGHPLTDILDEQQRGIALAGPLHNRFEPGRSQGRLLQNMILFRSLSLNCPNERDEKGRSVLHLAALHGCDMVMRAAVCNPHIGFDLEAVDKEGRTVMHYLVESDCQSARLIQGLLSEDHELVELMGVNTKAFDSNTPLHRAVRHDDPNVAMRCVQFLLNVGAKPFVPNNAGFTARDLAKCDAVRTLLKQHEDKPIPVKRQKK